MKCLTCNGKLSKTEYDKLIDHGQPPLCSQYCFEIYNGSPMPIDNSSLVFDKQQEKLESILALNS